MRSTRSYLHPFEPSEQFSRGERSSGTEAKIKFVQASEFFDFAVVAQSSRIANYPEESLRLLNGYYPRGTPEAGEWVKLIE